MVARVAEARDVEIELRVDGRVIAPSASVAAVAVDADLLIEAGPWLPGLAREAMSAVADRRRGGVHHTSAAMAAELVAIVAEMVPFSSTTVVADPSTGGGAFLLAALEALPGSPSDRLARVVGCDIDPLAVAVTEASLRLWGSGAALPDGAIRVADGLDPEAFARQPSVVIGNPPFLSQLRDDTARDDTRRAQIRARWPEVARYVDDAAAFLLAGVDAVDDQGVVALVQPSSFLAAGDAAALRARLMDSAPPVGIWVDGERQFVAAVDTVAVIVQTGAVPDAVQRWVGVPAEPLAPIDAAALGSSWAALLPGGPPPVDLVEMRTHGTVGDVARVTAGFRDQYYGLTEAVHDDPDGEHHLVTSGLIDPLVDRWGAASCTFARTRWPHPCVALDRVDPAIASWVSDRLVPKLLLASQTRVLEVMIDRDGTAVPCTPVVSVEPHEGSPSLSHLAAALTAPLISALLVRDAAGSALSRDAVRVAASAIAALPLPQPGPAWDAAAAAVDALEGAPTAAELATIGELASLAYGTDRRGDVFSWWHSRLPRR